MKKISIRQKPAESVITEWYLNFIESRADALLLDDGGSGSGSACGLGDKDGTGAGDEPTQSYGIYAGSGILNGRGFYDGTWSAGSMKIQINQIERY
jgi:hypothetical protein